MSWKEIETLARIQENKSIQRLMQEALDVAKTITQDGDVAVSALIGLLVRKYSSQDALVANLEGIKMGAFMSLYMTQLWPILKKSLESRDNR